jgi:hypothetical protein
MRLGGRLKGRLLDGWQAIFGGTSHPPPTSEMGDDHPLHFLFSFTGSTTAYLGVHYTSRAQRFPNISLFWAYLF